MSLVKKNGHILTHFWLLFAAVLFLGEVEVSTYANGLGNETTMQNQHLRQTIASADEFFLENGEERDIESRADMYVLTDDISLPHVGFVQTYLFQKTYSLPSGGGVSLQNSRAPPAF